MEEGGLAAALEWWRAEFIDAEMTVARREVAAECGYRWTRPVRLKEPPCALPSEFTAPGAVPAPPV
jgi:hypothetical protein